MTEFSPMTATLKSRPVTREAAEKFLYRETRLIDERRLEDWARLFAEDGIYWLPLGEGKDHRTEPAILCDGPKQRAMRIHQLLNYTHFAQDPPSRLIHFVSNIEIDDQAGIDEILLRCNALIQELRPGDFQELQIGLGSQRTLATRCEYRIRVTDDWRILEKKVLLLDRDQPVSNLTCIV
jgi:3-phenylpropionate/cinnamic acid dioxygenase small subunit